MTDFPHPDRVIIDLRKIAEYLLSRSHPIGRGKARFFEGLGFSVMSPDVLALAFRQLVRQPTDVTSQDTGYGTKYIVEGVLLGPEGSARVRTVWIVEIGSDVPRFVTAYPWR